MDLTFPIKNISIINYGGTDLVIIECNGIPNPFPESTPQNLNIRFECQATLGIQYLSDISNGKLKPNRLCRSQGNKIEWNDNSDIPLEEIKKEWEK